MANRKIIKTKHFKEFLKQQNPKVVEKIKYGLSMLIILDRLSEKFVKYIDDGIYELRIKVMSDIYRIFFIFDADNVVVLMNGFQKKTQKTPLDEIEKAKRIKQEYYDNKKNK